MVLGLTQRTGRSVVAEFAQNSGALHFVNGYERALAHDRRNAPQPARYYSAERLWRFSPHTQIVERFAGFSKGTEMIALYLTADPSGQRY